MKSKEFVLEIEKLSADQLRERMRELNEELMKLRFRHASGQLEQTHILKETKRNLARVNTALRQVANKEAAAS